ncbi:hypothetical protein PS726_00194 [Pseudomonas fluorescens]|uniref:hypothetical protein n=1 Tax=Pseudomonas fluorescens TaxID=294 RepID=UPI00123F768F|nr:hypothetical protein [Pseudomonas fluorescens]VVN67590.1 hypothetical protein PS726_00194 [Pseudomonas fluorescens]
MAIFDELRDRYTQYDAALTLQLQLLSKTADLLVSNLGPYIGLPHPTWHKSDGEVGGRYIRLGTGKESSFEEKNWTELSSLGGVVDFTLALMIDAAEDKFPKQNLIFEISVSFCSDGYQFKIRSFPEPIVVSTEDVRNRKFNAVYDALVDRIKHIFDPARVEIQK